MTTLDFPANPTTGQVFDRWVWDGESWRLAGSGGSGNGLVGYGISTRGTIGLTVTPADLLEAPVTFNAVAGRRYLLTGASAMGSGAGIASLLSVRISGGADVASGSSAGAAGLVFPTVIATAVFTPASTGPVSLMLMGSAASGTGNSVTSPSAPRFLLVEDITLSSGGGGGAGSDGFTFTQDTEPTGTTSGQTWFDTSTGDSFVWIMDVDSAQWVQFAPGGGGEVGPAVVVGAVGVASASFAPAGGVFTIPHPLGATPSAILITTTVDGRAGSNLLAYQVFDMNATQFRVQIVLTSTGAIVTDTNQRIAFFYAVYP